MALTRRQTKLLNLLEEHCYNVVLACSEAKISRGTYYRWMHAENTEFSLAAYNVKVDTGEMIDAEIDRRARIGVLEPVFFQGEIVGEIRKYSDTLLLARAKAHPILRHEYRERASIEHSGSLGGKDSEEAEKMLEEIEAAMQAPE